MDIIDRLRSTQPYLTERFKAVCFAGGFGVSVIAQTHQVSPHHENTPVGDQAPWLGTPDGA